ncbi:MAG: hypothetical protein QOD61_554, partial [Solirubrobacteraceae bacterium]|nr:hypothetical protein [Solirubrobacteraceae bacterium]
MGCPGGEGSPHPNGPAAAVGIIDSEESGDLNRLGLVAAGDIVGSRRRSTAGHEDDDRVAALARRGRLLEAGERVAQLGSWEWNPGEKLVWSDNLYRIFGVEPGSITPSEEYVLARTRPQDRERLASHIAAMPMDAALTPVEYRIARGRWGIRYLRSTTTSSGPTGTPTMPISGIVQDVTDQRLDAATHIAVSRVMARWRGIEESGRELLSSLAEALGYAFGTLWLPDERFLRPCVVWSDPSLEQGGELEAATLELRLPRGVGLAGRAWRDGPKPGPVGNVALDQHDPRRIAWDRAGLAGAVALPVRHADEVLAVLEFHHDSPPSSSRLARAMDAAGDVLGEFLARRRGQLGTDRLTPRMLQVLQLAADGYSGPRIAEYLAVSQQTVASHMKHIY